MDEEPVDDRLLRGMSAAAGEALLDAAKLFERHYSLDRWLVNGRSQAPVAVVFENDLDKDESSRLVLKVPAAEGVEPALSEHARHRRAVREAPKEFADAHFAPLKHDPVRVGAGSWITFQGVAGDDVESVEVLTVLLNGMLGITEGPATVACDHVRFARACGTVVSGVLEQWNGRPRTVRENLTVPEFLRTHVYDQLAPGGRLHPLSQQHPDDTIEIEGEPRPLANPLALARGAYFGDKRIVRALVGRTHGDLHTDNVLLRARPSIEVNDFHLIDLALYESEDPMTRDPVHLVLYILARRLDQVAPNQQAALIDVLLDPDSDRAALLPLWLTAILSEIGDAAKRWLKNSSLQPEWREQRLLSLVGCALLFLGRTSTRPEDHAWFMRLAARAADAYVALNEGAIGDVDATTPAAAPPPRLAWRAFPQPPSAVWLPALGMPRAQAAAVLEVHAVPAVNTPRPEARRLSALKDELVELGRAEGLFSAEEDVATADPAVAVGASGAGLAVLSDGQRTAWQALPEDPLGAVLDEDDVAGRLAVLLSALAKIPAVRASEVGLAVGVTPAGPLSEGRVADLPRTTGRGWSTRTPVRLPAEDALSFTYLEVRPREVADELAARLLRAFRTGAR